MPGPVCARPRHWAPAVPRASFCRVSDWPPVALPRTVLPCSLPRSNCGSWQLLRALLPVNASNFSRNGSAPKHQPRRGARCKLPPWGCHGPVPAVRRQSTTFSSRSTYARQHGVTATQPEPTSPFRSTAPRAAMDTDGDRRGRDAKRGHGEEIVRRAHAVER